MIAGQDHRLVPASCDCKPASRCSVSTQLLGVPGGMIYVIRKHADKAFTVR